MNLPGPSIPLASAVACPDCAVVYDGSGHACPKCGSELGAFPVENGHAAKEIKELRDLLAVCEGNFRIIALRQHGPTSGIAYRMVDRLKPYRVKSAEGYLGIAETLALAAGARR